jgi:hypothetical protein
VWTIISTYGFVLLGLGFTASGVLVIWWAMFADKSRGRRRCPRCWHDLSRTPGTVCGECGRVIAHERELFRTRQRWLVGGAALGILLTVTAWIRLEATSGGWSSLMPTPVLVGLVKLMEPPGLLQEGWTDLSRRVWRRELTPGTQVALAERLGDMCTDGELRDNPADLLVDVLRRDPAELLADPALSPAESEWRATALMEYKSQLDAALSAIPISVSGHLPPQWTAGVPLAISVTGMQWGQRVEWRAAVESAQAAPDLGHSSGPETPLASAGSEWLIWSSGGRLRSNGPLMGVLQLESPPIGKHLVKATLALQSRRWNWLEGSWGAWTDAPAVRVARVVDLTAPPPVKPVEGTLLQDAVLAAFGFPVTSWADDMRPVGLRYNPAALSALEYDDVLVGVVVELLEGDAVRRRTRFWWRGGEQRTARGGFGWTIELEEVEALRRLRESSEGWTVRVTGDVATALRALPTADQEAAQTDPALPARKNPTEWRTWVGQHQRPADVSRSTDPSPDRIWRMEPRVRTEDR